MVEGVEQNHVQGRLGYMARLSSLFPMWLHGLNLLFLLPTFNWLIEDGDHTCLGTQCMTYKFNNILNAYS